jgi:hypothetical protein
MKIVGSRSRGDFDLLVLEGYLLTVHLESNRMVRSRYKPTR